MLVDAINHRKVSAATESTVLGPFHMVESPKRELGDTIDLVATGQPCVVTGQVRSLDGTALPGAQVDVWQADDHGFYDVQQPGGQPAGNGRGLFTCDDEGRFWFRTVTPSAYPIPTDGPVGDLLTAAGRHPYRPAHIHLIVAAGGPSRSPPTSSSTAAPPGLRRRVRGQAEPSMDFTEIDDPGQAAAFASRPVPHASFDVSCNPPVTADPPLHIRCRAPGRGRR